VKNMSRGEKFVWATLLAGALAFLVACASGCSTLDRAAYRQEVTWTNAPMVQVFTNTVVVTNSVPVVIERTNIVFVTNAVSGAVAGYAVREPVATNMVTAIVTNVVPVYMTNLVQVPVTNLVAKPEAEAAISAAGSVVNTFAPGIGSIVALALGGLYHGYRQLRKVNVNTLTRNPVRIYGPKTRVLCPYLQGRVHISSLPLLKCYPLPLSVS